MSGILNQLLGAIVGGTGIYGHQQDRHAAESLAAEERARRLAAEQAAQQDRQEARYLQGFRPGQAPDAKGILNALQLGSSVADAGTPGVGVGAQVANAQTQAASPEQYAPDRFQQVNPSTYVDQTATPAAVQARHDERSAINAMRIAAAKPTPQQHVVDPVTGEVKFYDPTHPPASLRVNPAPKLPSFTPVTLGGTDGTPAVVQPFNTRTGQVGPVIGPAKPQAQLGRQPTDTQRQIGALLPEIKASHELLNTMGTQEALNAMASHAGMFSNYLKTEEGQRYQQAADQFITNLIYAKSGKAVTDAERAALWRTYIGEPGNTPSVLKAKQKARELALQGVGTMAPALAGAVQSQQGHAPPGDVNLGGDTAGHTMPVNDPEATWAAKNPPHPGESFDAYHARYLKAAGGHH